MKAFVFLFSLMALLLLSPNAEAQVVPDSIHYVEQTFGYSLQQGPMTIGRNRIQALTKNCPRAWDMYKTGKQTEAFGMMLSVCGVVCTATALGGHFFNDQALGSTPLIFAGVTMLGLGIPINIGGVRKVKSFVYVFNKDCAVRR
jgi:hypothetical protein